MKIVKPGFRIANYVSTDAFLELCHIENVARTCYQSHDNFENDTAEWFIHRLIERGHESMLEHSYLSVIFTVDRAVANELVRHRIASFAQESTRYCNYSKEKFGEEIAVIMPYMLEEGTAAYNAWYFACEMAEQGYMTMLRNGCTPEIARSVLPLCTKTDIVVSTNYREWRHIFKLRTAKNAHPQLKEVLVPLLEELCNTIPIVFYDIWKDYSDREKE